MAKPFLIVTNGVTGESLKYQADNVVELETSLDDIDDHFDLIARRKKNLNKARQEGHIRLMQAKAVEYVKTEGFQGSYSAVFLLMLGTAKYGGRVPLTKAQMAENLNYSLKTVSRALNHLKENGMITEGEHEGRQHYFLPSSTAQKGSMGIKSKDQKFKVIDGGKLKA